MTETREQRIERWARALIELQIRQVRRHDTAPERLEDILPAAIDHAWPDKMADAEAIDASNTAAGLVMVNRKIVDRLLTAYERVTVDGPSPYLARFGDAVHDLRKEIEG